jgi:hypothetical protein
MVASPESGREKEALAALAAAASRHDVRSRLSDEAERILNRRDIQERREDDLAKGAVLEDPSHLVARG